MKVTFDGTLDNFIAEINKEGVKKRKDVVVYYDDDSNEINVGYERMGHSGGRYYTATVEETDSKVLLDGEINTIIPRGGSKIVDLLQEVVYLFGMYVILLIIPFLIGKFTFGGRYGHFAFLVPVAICLYTCITDYSKQTKKDREFINGLIVKNGCNVELNEKERKRYKINM